MQNCISIFAEAAAPAQQGSGSSMLIFIVLMFAAMYFLMIAPQRKRQKALKKMISELKSGDKVLTIGGAIGTVTNVKEKTIVVRLGDNIKVEFIKSAVQEKIASSAEQPEAEKKPEAENK